MNCCKAATSNLLNFVELNGIDIVLFQDAYRRGGNVIGFPKNWNIYSSGNNGAGIAIVKPNFKTNLILRGEFSVAINIQLSSGSLTACSVYSPPSADLSVALNSIDEVVELPAVLVAGDFNAKSRIWGYRRDDCRGDEKVDFCIIKNLNIKNDREQPPTFFSAGKSGWPDLTIVTPNLNDNLTF